MENHFFTSWKWWQKLVFLFACAFVLTVGVGFISLSIVKRRSRKYNPVHTKSNYKTTQTKYVLEDPESPFDLDEPEPYTHTIAPISHASHPSTKLSKVSVHSFSSNCNLSYANTLRDGDSEVNANIEYSKLDDHAAEIGKAISTDLAENSLLHQLQIKAASLPSCSLKRSSSVRSHNTQALQTLEGKIQPTNPHDSTATDRESLPSYLMAQKRAEDAKLQMDINEKTETQEDRKEEKTLSEKSEADLSLLNSHRLTHVAETGQLTPRVRRQVVKCPSDYSINSNKSGLTNPIDADFKEDGELTSKCYLTINGLPLEPSQFPRPPKRPKKTRKSGSNARQKFSSNPHMGISKIDENHANESVPANHDDTNNLQLQLQLQRYQNNVGFEVLPHGAFARTSFGEDVSGEKKDASRGQKDRRPATASKVFSKIRRGLSRVSA